MRGEDLYQESLYGKEVDPVVAMDHYLSWSEKLKGVHDLSFDLRKGIMYAFEDISDRITQDFLINVRHYVGYIEAINDGDLTNQSFTLILGSFGGDFESALGIIDYMESLPIGINVVARSKAMSAAAFILACGTGIRAVNKSCIVMFHEPSLHNLRNQKLNVIKDTVSYYDHITDSFLDKLEKRSNQSKEWWKTNIQKELYLTSTQALEYGLIDKIL